MDGGSPDSDPQFKIRVDPINVPARKLTLCSYLEGQNESEKAG